MKKHLLFCILVVVLTITNMQVSAQISVNTDGSQPDGSAMLDVKSTSKGMLVPRMTFEERNAIVNPAKGLMVFCTTDSQYYFNRGTPAFPYWVTSMSMPYSGSFTTYETLIDLTNNGTGGAGSFIINNPANYSSAIYAQTNGPGWTIASYNTGSTDGFAGYFRNTSPTNNWAAIQGKTAGTGPVFAAYQTLGPGGGLGVWMLYPSSTAAGIAVYNNALGNACQFFLNNAASTASALHTENNGTGDVGFFQTNSPSGSNAAVKGRATNTGGGAGAFEINNAANANTGLYSYTQGVGGAGSFSIDNNSNSNSALWAGTNGIGSAAGFNIDNANNGSPALSAGTNGTGNAGSFSIDNNSNTNSALHAGTNGLGSAGDFIINNASNTYSSLYSETNGTAQSGIFQILNGSNTSVALHAETNGTGTALYSKTTGTGTALMSTHNGSSGNIAIFQSSYVNKARIDKTGKGFFNGGTQTGGADVAELFDVEGPVVNYEPGDVMVISESSDRTMEKSSEPVSTRVAGVYATKPGVILTEKDIEDNLDQLVPVGVIGVIPTKVCDENGPIKRGDLLVTSNSPGHAMKAIPVKINGILIYPTGAILGKALENFETGKSGLINVLVNVK